MRLHVDTVARSVKRAIPRGARAKSFRDGNATLNSWSVDYSGDCQSPVVRTFNGRPSPDDGRWVTIAPGRRNSLYMDMTLRCRMCESCLRARSRHWAARARAETASSSRTWFATLTLRPSAQDHYLHVARQAAAMQQEDLDRGSPSEIFAARCAAVGPELQRFLKRVRKNSQARIRYLLVAEAHKSGAPHFHALLHETGDKICTHEVLTKAWLLGFSKFKLVPPTEGRLVHYVTKYLAKSSLARVRASLGYGAECASDLPANPDLSPSDQGGASTDIYMSALLVEQPTGHPK